MKKASLVALLILPLLLMALPEGSEAPSVMFRTLDNEMIFSRDFVGEPRILKPDEPRKNLLLVFFRTNDMQIDLWLPPLSSELGRLSSSKFQVYLVSVDESAERIRSFQKDYNPSLEVLLDKFGAACELFGMTDLNAFSQAPALILIDSSGNIRYFNDRFSSDDIAELLMKAAEMY